MRKKVVALRAKKQDLRDKRKALKKPDSPGYIGPDVTTTSYLRAQGKAYAKGRTAKKGYKAGEERAGQKSKAPEAKSVKAINKRIRAIDRRIKRVKKG